MAAIYEGKLLAKGLKFAVVVSRFNEFITNRLLAGTMDALGRHGAEEDKIKIYWVPGAFEIPVMAKKLVSKDFQAVICLGAIIRGATPHFEYVSGEVAKGIAQVGLMAEKPVIYGVITADTIEQAVERAGSKAGNRGWDAAISAIEMANLFNTLENDRRGEIL